MLSLCLIALSLGVALPASISANGRPDASVVGRLGSVENSVQTINHQIDRILDVHYPPDPIRSPAPQALKGQLGALGSQVTQAGRALLIIAEDVEGEALSAPVIAALTELGLGLNSAGASAGHLSEVLPDIHPPDPILLAKMATITDGLDGMQTLVRRLLLGDLPNDFPAAKGSGLQATHWGALKQFVQAQ